MTKREKDFEKEAEDFCLDLSHCIFFEAGAEYGYQYAVDKACEWLETHLLHAEADGYMTIDLFKQFKQFMEE